MSDVVRENLANGNVGKASLSKPAPPPQGTNETPARNSFSGSQDFENRLRQASSAPMTYQPERGSLFQQLYVAHFIASGDLRIHSWLAELPNILARPVGNEEIFAIRAATMALYSKVTQNRELQAEALKWYSKGLEAQRMKLSLASQKGSVGTCSRGAIGAAILFSYFECIMCTMPMGHLQHYAAAAEIVEVAGPETCQSGLMHMFFRSLRISSVRLYLFRY